MDTLLQLILIQGQGDSINCPRVSERERRRKPEKKINKERKRERYMYMYFSCLSVATVLCWFLFVCFCLSLPFACLFCLPSSVSLTSYTSLLILPTPSLSHSSLFLFFLHLPLSVSLFLIPPSPVNLPPSPFLPSYFSDQILAREDSIPFFWRQLEENCV